ncbi:MAG: sepF 1 [Massilibacillus sp.]|jgi:cell division inhibitor SepF|nr:sepF 1 [Massilibacillus sp.]
MSSLLDKLTNVLMPEEEEEVKREEPVKRATERTGIFESQDKMERPVLTVHTNPDLKIKVFVPTTFDQANLIADCLKSKESVVVNYEQVDNKEQRRLCDFLNGVCYVLNGGVQRITNVSVLYVPDNVEISKEMCSYTMPVYEKQAR